MLSLEDDDDLHGEERELSGQDLSGIVDPLPLDDNSGEEDDSLERVPLDIASLLVRKRPSPDQEIVTVAVNEESNKPKAKPAAAVAPAKKRRATSTGEKKKPTGPSNSIAAMVSCLSGAAKPAELADLGDEGLLLAQAPVVKPRPATSTGGPADQAVGEHSWLRESAAFSSFTPACTEEAFMQASSRLSGTASVMKEFVEVMTKELSVTLEEAKQIPRSRQKPGDEAPEASLVKRIRTMEALLASLERRTMANIAKVTQLGNSLREHTELHLELMRRHREYVRNLICHFTRTYTFDPDTPGSHLISDPFIMT